MCICVRVHMCIYMHICVSDIHIYICAYIHIFVYICTCNTYIYYALVPSTSSWVICMYICIHISVCIHICVYIHMHIIHVNITSLVSSTSSWVIHRYTYICIHMFTFILIIHIYISRHWSLVQVRELFYVCTQMCRVGGWVDEWSVGGVQFLDWRTCSGVSESCSTHEWEYVKTRVVMGCGVHVRASWRTEWVIVHTRVSHGTHMSESWHTREGEYTCGVSLDIYMYISISVYVYVYIYTWLYIFKLVYIYTSQYICMYMCPTTRKARAWSYGCVRGGGGGVLCQCAGRDCTPPQL